MDSIAKPESDAGRTWWFETLERLELQLETLVDDFIRRLGALTPEYRGVSATDIRDTARASLGLLISQLVGRPSTTDLRGLAEQLGVRRARQGVDRDLLLEAVRLDYRVLWTGLARITPPEHSAHLMRHAEEVLSTVEQYIREVQVAFLNERDALAQSSRANETRAVARLLSAEDPSRVVAEVAELLGITIHADYEIVLVPTDSASEAKRLARASQRSRERFIIWDFDDCVLFVREQRSGPLTHRFNAVRGILIEHVPGLAQVPVAVQAAHRLVPYLKQARLYREHELWLALAAQTLSPLLPCLSEDAVIELRRLPPLEQERLVTNFLSYCETGSIKDTAAATFVHRNTVVNRLRAFHEVTGLNPTVPVEAARALILVS